MIRKSNIGFTCTWRNFCVILLLIASSAACKKEKNTITPDAVFYAGEQVRLNDIEILSDGRWIVCGGIRNEKGFFFRSDDFGVTWNKVETAFARSLYTVHFSDSLHGLAGGDQLDIWKTEDGGNSWYFQWLEDQVPMHEEDRPAIRNILLRDDSTWFFCGGENLGEGVIYRSRDAGQHWDFTFYQNEFRALTELSDGTVLAGGHGKVVVSRDDFLSTQDAVFESDFMVSVMHIGNDQCIGVSYDGVIYKSSDGGMNWNITESGNRPFGRRTNWNMITGDDRVIFIVGNGGILAKSIDEGRSWSFATLEGEPDLFSVAVEGDRIVATSDQGRVYVFRWT